MMANLQMLIEAGQVQQHRQQQRLEQLCRQADLELAAHESWLAKQRVEEYREYARSEARNETYNKSMHRTNRAAQRREAVRRAAEERQQQIRDAAEEKERAEAERQALHQAQLDIQREISAQKSAVKDQRRQQIKEQNTWQLLEQHERMAQKMEIAEINMKQKDLEREIAARQRAQVAHERSQRRQEAIQRATADLEAKTEYYETKLEEKDAQLQARQAEEAAALRQKYHENLEKRERAQMVVERARAEDSCLRQQLAERYEEKMLRGDVLAIQRGELLAQMASIRKEMLSQEATIKGAIETMHRTGRLDLPPELEQLRQTVRANTAAGCSLGTSRRATLGFGGCDGSSERSVSERSESRAQLSGRRGRAESAGAGSAGSGAQRRLQSGRLQQAGRTQSLVLPSNARGRPGGAALRIAPQEPPLDARRAAAGGGSLSHSQSAPLTGVHTEGSDAQLTAQERELKSILEEEQAREADREELLERHSDPMERKRLQRIFAYEREQAKERIMALGLI